ncbi:MAG: RES family NAD+ phosphorylase [Acidimicrobiales bacterium]
MTNRSPTVADPPTDYGTLASRFPTLAKDRIPELVHRVHRVDREPEWFTDDALYRWAPPPEPAVSFGTCYVATDPLTALMEVVGDFDVVTPDMLASRALATMSIQAGQFADMENPAIASFGLDRRISIGDDYGACQRWAKALWLAGFNGVHYEPRHDPRGSGFTALALFGDPGHQPAQVRLVDDGPIDDAIIAELTRVFNIRVLPPTPLTRQ